VKFGVFDHMDDAGIPHGELFAGRLRLAEAYDRHGFYGYHLAEHHGTPIGVAASPGIFLAALAQRTTKLRFGPLVYLLPFYHPLRLIEEICMLDQMSGGRLELGIGRGVSPFETANYALDFSQTGAMYDSPLRGVGRHVVVAETDAEALAIARRAYPKWRTSFFWLFNRRGSAPRVASHYPDTFDELATLKTAVAGSPQTVRDFIAADIAAAGANYAVPWLAFGDMTADEALHSVELFATEVIPAFT
jgi:alkanesulfonate monooxygenase SsuD/methylene tetrahydromethanopterin reductase-like flavin-dependent oxidoreductase (luciferase family)